MADPAWYVYAVGHAGDPTAEAAIDSLAGHHDAPIERIVDDGLAAYASPVDPELFSEAALARQLEDLAWLEAVARTHHHVADTICARTTAIPLQLATVFHTPDRVRAMLVARHDDMLDRLAAVAGCREWGVKAYALAEDTPAPAEPDTRLLGPGAAYLARRRAARDQQASRAVDHRSQARQVDDTLQRHARQVRQHAPQNPRLSGRSEPMLLNQAYLVAEAEQRAFHDALAGLQRAHPGLELVLTGPWAPYSFVDTASAS